MKNAQAELETNVVNFVTGYMNKWIATKVSELVADIGKHMQEATKLPDMEVKFTHSFELADNSTDQAEWNKDIAEQTGLNDHELRKLLFLNEDLNARVDEIIASSKKKAMTMVMERFQSESFHLQINIDENSDSAEVIIT
jgi:hypothetical protein